MVLRIVLTLVIDHDPDLIPGQGPDPAPAATPPAVAERPLWRQLLFAWFEDNPDDPER